MIGATKIGRREFYADGGLSNPHLFRRARGGSWQHYRSTR